jgi:hypothetical protein
MCRARCTFGDAECVFSRSYVRLLILMFDLRTLICIHTSLLYSILPYSIRCHVKGFIDQGAAQLFGGGGVRGGGMNFMNMTALFGRGGGAVGGNADDTPLRMRRWGCRSS